MTMNSIEYITKKHFRSGLSMIVTLIAVAIAVLSAYLAFMKGFSPVLAAFAFLSALFSIVSLFSAGKGCTLLRIPIAVTAVACFFTAMGMFTLGYLFIIHSGTQERINELLKSLHYNTIATQPNVTGALFIIGSVLLYIASGCAFFGHRYLGAARSCSSGTLRRSGFRVFPVLSVILFVLTAGAAAGFLLLSGDSFITELTTDPFSMMTALLLVLLMLHLLFSGICAGSFARKSFAFKVFEKQIMKVETNADGTVYVPINEDKEPDAEEPLLLPSKKKESNDSQKRGKPYIKEFSPAVEDAAEHSSTGEGDIVSVK